MKILVLSSRQKSPFIHALQPVLKPWHDILVSHHIQSIVKEKTGFFETLSQTSLILVFLHSEDLYSDWCAYLAGYSQKIDCDLILYHSEEMIFPPFLSKIEKATTADELSVLLESWHKKELKNEACREVQNKGLYLTPYHFIKNVKEGEKETVKLYLVAGFSPDTVDDGGVPALCAAARLNDLEMCQLLLDQGANINLVSTDRNNNALMDASANGNSDLVKLLISRGSDLNVQSKNDQTALMLAVGIGNVEIVTLLLEAKAEKDLKDVLGMTAPQYAKILGNQNIAALFES